MLPCSATQTGTCPNTPPHLRVTGNAVCVVAPARIGSQVQLLQQRLEVGQRIGAGGLGRGEGLGDNGE